MRMDEAKSKSENTNDIESKFILNIKPAIHNALREQVG